MPDESRSKETIKTNAKIITETTIPQRIPLLPIFLAERNPATNEPTIRQKEETIGNTLILNSKITINKDESSIIKNVEIMPINEENE